MAKPKKCRVCREEFKPFRTTATVCSLECSITQLRAKADKDYRSETKRRREAIRTHSEWVAFTQVAFNKYIRARDAALNLPCISCGEYYAEPLNGSLWDCGHFKPTSTHMELRFNEINAHRQHSRCNRGAAKSGRNDRSVSEKYRANLINRIGLPLVEWLESPHKPLKPTIEELKWLRSYYSRRAREAAKAQEGEL